MSSEIQKSAADKPAPRVLSVASEGITTSKQFARFMSLLMSDLVEGRITPEVGNAAVNAGGKLLKVVEMQARYGTAGPGAGQKVLVLTEGPAVE